jgi:tetratricopeptide (TPR) repeat protein
MNNASQAYLQLLERFYRDQPRRELVMRRLRSVLSQLPLMPRVEGLLELAACAIGHEDHAHALTTLKEAQAEINGRRWLMYDRLPLQARLIRLRWQAGDHEQAKRDVDAALAEYDAARDNIDPVWRAETLCPIAETYQAMGESALALSVYRRAIEEGAINPNSRPRAEDLAGTCCSLAVSGVKPDADLWQRIRAVRDGLRQPW